MIPASESYTTMSIASLGPATLSDSVKSIRRYNSEKRPINDISDIEGAHFVSSYEKYTNKPKYNDAIEVPGSSPRRLIREQTHGRPDFTLKLGL